MTSRALVSNDSNEVKWPKCRFWGVSQIRNGGFTSLYELVGFRSAFSPRLVSPLAMVSASRRRAMGRIWEVSVVERVYKLRMV